MLARRAVLVGAGAFLLAGRAAAQPRVHRMGYLGPGSPAPGPIRTAFFNKLQELGYRVGQNLAVESRFADGRLDRLPALAAELVDLRPDLLYTVGTTATLEASRATRTIPIVFAAVTDPVGLGIVKSLRKPGTNATGLSNQADEMQVKLMQLVKEAFPAASSVAVLYNPLNAPEVRTLPALRRASATLGLGLRTIEARAPEELEPAIRELQAKRPDVLYVMSGPLVDTHRERVVVLVNGQGQAAVYGPGFVEAGGLMSFSFSLMDQHLAATAFIDKIFRGATPASLPVEQPTRFELVVNARTAKAQGVRFPSGLLLRADRVIE